MKLKEEKVEKEGMNKGLYNLFLELINLEYNKMRFLDGAKFYCWIHGLQKYNEFFQIMANNCTRCKDDFCMHLLSRFEDIPEIKIDAIKVNYDSAEEVFTKFAELEDKFIELIERSVTKSKELDDVNAMAFLFKIMDRVDHIACRALEAVRNNKNPLDLIRFCENDNLW